MKKSYLSVSVKKHLRPTELNSVPLSSGQFYKSINSEAKADKPDHSRGGKAF
jgi:hypothetical protein